MANDAVLETHEPATHVQRSLNPFERLTQFLHDTREEMRKVTTPSRAEVQSTTIVVVVAVFMFAGYFALVDFVVSKTLDTWMLHLTRH
jgi:preprotein translocase subunit SecE